MSELSDYSEVEIAKWLLGKADPPATGTRYAALFTANPSDSGGGTEVSGGSYARTAITAAFPTPSGTGGSWSNSSATIEFPEATASWGTVTAVGIFDASTAGNLLAWSPLDSSVAVASGQTFRFNTSALTLTIA